MNPYSSLALWADCSRVANGYAKGCILKTAKTRLNKTSPNRLPDAFHKDLKTWLKNSFSGTATRVANKNAKGRKRDAMTTNYLTTSISQLVLNLSACDVANILHILQLYEHSVIYSAGFRSDWPFLRMPFGWIGWAPALSTVFHFRNDGHGLSLSAGWRFEPSVVLLVYDNQQVASCRGSPLGYRIWNLCSSPENHRPDSGIAQTWGTRRGRVGLSTIYSTGFRNDWPFLKMPFGWIGWAPALSTVFHRLAPT